MAKIEQDLKQIFENNFDCYTTFETCNIISKEMAMTKAKFIEIVGGLLMEHKANQANSNIS